MARCWKEIMLLVYCGLALALPLLIYGFPFPTHDGEVHMRWYYQFSRQFCDGELYPRWLIDLNYGFGSPTFFYYPPTPYWISGLFAPLCSNLACFSRVLGIAAALALLASGVCAYIWLRTFSSAKASCLGAVMYMAMPYHLPIDLWTRGAYAEFWAFAWMPLVLYYTRRLITGSLSAFIGTALSYALLVTTHLPTTLIFSLIPISHILLVGRGCRFQFLFQIVGAMAIGVALSAMYLLPALFSQGAVSMNAMRVGHFYFANGFFFPTAQLTQIARDDFERTLFWIVLVTVGVIALASTRFRDICDEKRMHGMLWIAWSAVCVCMMFSFSRPLWNLIPQLQVIQFPWRFNAPLCVASTAALVILLAPRTSQQTALSRSVLVAIGIFGCAWVPIYASSFRQAFSTDRWNSEEQAVARLTSADVPEYRPSFLRQDIGVFRARFLIDNVLDSDRQVLIAEGDGIIEVQRWKPRDLRIHVESKQGLRLHVRQLYYPGWRAFELPSLKPVFVGPSSEGLLEVTVDAGTHTVAVALTKTLQEELGYAISAIMLLGIVCLAIASNIRRLLKWPWRRSEVESGERY